MYKYLEDLHNSVNHYFQMANHWVKFTPRQFKVMINQRVITCEKFTDIISYSTMRLTSLLVKFWYTIKEEYPQLSENTPPFSQLCKS